MRMQIPFLFALLAWLGCSGDTPTNHGEAGQPLRVEWEEGDVIVAMGTSLTSAMVQVAECYRRAVRAREILPIQRC